MKVAVWMRTILGSLAGLALAAGLATAQKPKSQKEVDAINAVFTAQDPAARIKLADAAMQQFADTEFKPVLLMLQTESALQMNDRDKVIVYGEQALKADPKSYQVQLWIATAIVQGTKEFDLDKEDKLKRADKLLDDSLKNLAVAVKPNPQLTDDQWLEAKKDLEGQCHETMGMAASLRKNSNGAIEEFQKAITLNPGNLNAKVRLAGVYNTAGKFPEATKLADEILATPNLHPALKQYAEAEKQRAAKGGK
jgi:tetratricopeptide (TPR) repeat protein